jgi:hypothetical protein
LITPENTDNLIFINDNDKKSNDERFSNSNKKENNTTIKLTSSNNHHKYTNRHKTITKQISDSLISNLDRKL